MSGPDPIHHIIQLNDRVGALTNALEQSERERKSAQEQQAEIKDSVDQIAARLAAMPDQEHAEHHQFVRVLLKDYEQRQELRAAIIQKIATGGAWALLAGLVALAWSGFKHKFGVGE